MKVFYAVWAEIPSRAAHSLHFMKQCQGVAANSVEVILIFPELETNKNIPDKELYRYYNVRDTFSLHKIPVNKRVPAGKLRYCLKVANFVKAQNGILFTRDTDLASVSTLFKIKTILELHRPFTPGKHIWGYLQRRLLKSPYLLNIIAITRSLKDIIVKDSGIRSEQIIVAHDASDLPEDKLKSILFEDTHNYMAEVGYVGHLYKGKGVELIFKIALQLPNVRFHIVGGLEEDIKYWKEKFKQAGLTNTLFHGFVTQASISAYINSFDICLLPNQRVVEIYGNDKVNISNFTSPLKMFDYMAHGKAIISSDLAVLKEVLNEDNAMLCDPDDAGAWVNAIELLMNDGEKRGRLGENARRDLKDKYTWKKRGQLILDKLIN